ncbi:glycosyltransferase family 4 protein [Granulicella aggregans]|uniref:glycosyltransferase family 4 protein n=1 Tax=Granulicella aggregans TaxID=474949 RepID=UPI0021DF894F|nr:glycosyltransferase family 1 protein [Granulicella aggregans]
MRPIYINGRFLAARLSGVPRFGRELLHHLDLLLDTLKYKVTVVILVPKSVTELFPYKHLIVRPVGILSGHSWEQCELPFYAFNGILFSPSGSAPLIHPRNLLTIHDAIVFAAPAGFSRSYLIWYRFLSLVLCRTALCIVTVSQFSKRELVRWCGAHPSRITVAYPGAQHLLQVTQDNSIQSRFDLTRFRYALAVGSMSPNKNFKALIAALAFLEGTDIEVVLVGQTASIVGRHGSKEEPLNLSKVKNVGYISDEELRSLYENAGCFVFPSLYEGFGLPPLEALSLGCPIVVSDTASLPEVCGEVAVLCDPHSPEDIAMKIRYAVHLREDPSNAERFTRFAARYNYKTTAGVIWNMIVKAAAVGEQCSDIQTPQ